VRIIAGSRKGHTIYAPKGLDTRPTADRVREAAFNLIGPVDGASVLDLFAGSGAMGLEALSRGAERAVFVEADRTAARAVERNLEMLGLTGARVVCDEVLRFLATERGTYDLVFVDPPYDSDFSAYDNRPFGGADQVRLERVLAGPRADGPGRSRRTSSCATTRPRPACYGSPANSPPEHWLCSSTVTGVMPSRLPW